MPELADPWALLLVPLPLLAARLLPPMRAGGGALAVPERVGLALIAAARTGKIAARLSLRQVLLWGIWLLLVVAIAGPRSVTPVPALRVSGRDLAVVLDLSGSMVRDDFFLDGQPATRLDAVKRVGAAFVRRRAGDRVALVVFGSEAYYAAAFSHDVEAVAQRIEAAEIGISGRATNIPDGLGLALKRLQRSEAASKVVILLSDGSSNAGATEPAGVARMARDMGVTVHTIALGPKDAADASPSDQGVVDAKALRVLAEITGGENFRVRTTEDLVAVGEALDRLEATEGDGLSAEVFRELWVWPAGMALVLSLGLAWRET
ncbi:VWA domain-containing protein [Mangrovicoccus sp. HB161399]|uniref:VWA domain-containing protein n=1 Tax=Mangrovicoccus sp. HB161399 TaxID=2720392 RepID=UPI001553004C|nr:VWA domain-containing protein [Mangrovicoccus sp. HB161399]